MLFKKFFIIFVQLVVVTTLATANTCPKWFPLPTTDGLHAVIPIYDESITAPDFDCDEIVDTADPDIDNDGVLNAQDPNDYNTDSDNDGIPDKADADMNGDGIVDNGVDTDGDGYNNAADDDDDNDGMSDSEEIVEGRNPLLKEPVIVALNDAISGIEPWIIDDENTGTHLIKDINPQGGLESSPSNLVVKGSHIYFFAEDKIRHRGLWKSSGDEGEAGLISPQYRVSSELINVNNTLYFIVDGKKLKRSDGTRLGTVIVKYFSEIESLFNLNGVLYFVANDGTHGKELWKSDGTRLGTVMVKDIRVDAMGSNPSNLTMLNSNTLGFFADDGIHGKELWRSGGEESDTVMVKDIHSGSTGSSPSSLTNVNGTLYFSANDGTHGQELWKSTGLLSTTEMVEDINLGSASSWPLGLTNVNGRLYFTASDGINGGELWRSQGTASNTFMLKDIHPSGSSLPSFLTNVNGMLYFVANDGAHGSELWKSNGTNSGTMMVKDISANSSHPLNLMAAGGTLYFSADDGVNGRELWKSDGTNATTYMMKDINQNGHSNPHDMIYNDGVLYFAAKDAEHGTEFWKSSGTQSSTIMIKDIASKTEDSLDKAGAEPFLQIGSLYYFVANDNVHGKELWVTDGTAPGTVMVKDINNGGDDSQPKDLFNLNGILYFTADNGTNGRELWKSNGTPSGTVMVKDIASGVADAFLLGYYSRSFAKMDGLLYFAADDGIHGRELWRSDGTPGGTTIVKDIYTGNDDAIFSDLINVNGLVCFTAAYESDSGLIIGGIWQSNGTPEGTMMIVENINAISYKNVNNRLYFLAHDLVYGMELWKTDLTEASTTIVKDIVEGSESSSISDLTSMYGVLYFDNHIASEYTHPLFRTDGTESGTKILTPPDIDYFGGLININDTLYFLGGSFNIVDLWKSKGTEASKVNISSPSTFNMNIIGSVYGNVLLTLSDKFGSRLLKSDGSEGSAEFLVGDVYAF